MYKFGKIVFIKYVYILNTVLKCSRQSFKYGKVDIHFYLTIIFKQLILSDTSAGEEENL